MSKTLIAYFSTGGTNKKLATEQAGKIGADLYKIKPKETYMEKDLNWVNPLSRSTKEYITKKEPEMEEKLENIAPYDSKILGAPIWFFKDPNVKRDNISYNISLPVRRAIFLQVLKKPYFLGLSAHFPFLGFGNKARIFAGTFQS